MATSRAAPAFIAQYERFAIRAGQAQIFLGGSNRIAHFIVKLQRQQAISFLTMMGLIDEIRQLDFWQIFRNCFGKEDTNGKSTTEHMAIIDAMHSLQPQTAE